MKLMRSRLSRFIWISVSIIIGTLLLLFISVEYLPGESYFESSGLSASSLSIHFLYVYKLTYGSDIGISREYGMVSYVNGKMILHQIFSESNPPGMYDTLNIIRWGKRTYLIDHSSIYSFCRHITNGWEPRNQLRGGFLLAENDWNIPVTGKPDLPEEYLKTIADTTIERRPNPFY